MKQLKVALRIIGIGLVCLLPTPWYGKHGGFYVESKETPIDDMDRAFKKHDEALEYAYKTWQVGIKNANYVLYNKLKDECKPRSLYGKFYRLMSLIIFKVGS